MALVLGALVFVLTVLAAAFVAFAEGMSDAPVTRSTAPPVLAIGGAISALIVASHWLPHIGW